ncbi:hypothetical protein JKI95_02750 [Corynebacterium aquatimens]|uniref:DUF6542 domain-containing protein n=1 Tax=Corynebacterium TaxID=1716 RepID=UPI001F280315|nr:MULTISPECIES: DUF6542 domain-containing protein [Corynebacterium]QYH19988.1 hypothetical protein JKI95_02750 [Corynebacterium aquatimens]UIZ92824.1 hypothetical protein JZY91_03425 [Corynebacterium sp. CNCTC7651]
MTHTPNRARAAAPTTFAGLPTGSAIGIIFAALFTGALIAIYTGQVGWPLLALFATAVVLTTTLVNPRGIFLTVASSPLLFVAAVVATGYVLGREQIASGGASAKTAQLLVVYPLVEVFPVLLTVTLGAIVIGVLRIWLIKRQNKAVQRYEVSERSRAAASNRRTNTQGRRARERSGGIGVDELVRREKAARASKAARSVKQSSKSVKPQRQNRGGSTRIAGRLGDDLYGDS